MDYLVVEDDPVLSGLLARALVGDVCCVATLAAARAQLKSTRVDPALVLDIVLPDGSGLELLSEIRGRESWRPVLVITGTRDEATVSTVQRLGGLFVYKPIGLENIEAFAAFVQQSSAHNTRHYLHATTGTVAAEYKLSPREQEVLMMAAAGIPRTEIASRMGIEETTLKTFVRRIVRKARQCTLGDVVTIIHQRIFDSESTSQQSTIRSAIASTHEGGMASTVGAPTERCAVEEQAPPGATVLHDLRNIIMNFSGLRQEFNSATGGLGRNRRTEHSTISASFASGSRAP